MAGHDWRGQVAFWRGEARRRAIDGIARRLSPETGLLMQQALERRSAPPEIDYGWGNPLFPTVPAATESVARPQSLTVTDDSTPPRSDGHLWPEVGLHRVRRVVIDRKTGLVFSGRLVLEASTNDGRTAKVRAFVSGAGMRLAAQAQPPHVPGPVIPGGTPSNYFHFLTDLGPRVWAATRRVPEAVVMLSGPPPAYVSEVFDLLGVRWDVWTDLDPAACDDVVLVDAAPPAWPHPDLLTAFRDAVLEAVDATGPADGTDASDSATGARAYLSRAGSARAMAGEAELEDELARQGVASVRLERRTFVDQVRLMQSVALVIAPHGAGLANMMFLRPGARVVELTTGEWWMPAFRNMAAMLDVEHRLILLPGTPEHPFGDSAEALAALELELARPAAESPS